MATLTVQETREKDDLAVALLLDAGRSLTGSKAVKRNGSRGRAGSSGPRPTVKSATLKEQSQARKKPARPRRMAEEEKAKGAEARTGNTGSRATKRGSPGRRRDEDARAYSTKAATARYTMGMLSCRNSMVAFRWRRIELEDGSLRKVQTADQAINEC